VFLQGKGASLQLKDGAGWTIAAYMHLIGAGPLWTFKGGSLAGQRLRAAAEAQARGEFACTRR